MRKLIIECDRCGFSEEKISRQPSNNFVEVAKYELLDNTHDKDIDYSRVIDLNIDGDIDDEIFDDILQTKFLCKNCQKIFIKMCRELVVYFNNSFENFWSKSNIVNIEKNTITKAKNKSGRSLIIRR